MVLFNTIYSNAFHCMETCQKYNRARSPFFSDKTEMDKLLGFLVNTTLDPVTKTLYKDSYASTIWLPIRSMIQEIYFSKKLKRGFKKSLERLNHFSGFGLISFEPPIKNLTLWPEELEPPAFCRPSDLRLGFSRGVIF